MNTIIKSAYAEFENFNEDRVCSLIQIFLWVIKYEDLYKHITLLHQDECDACLNLFDAKLPYACVIDAYYCTKSKDFDDFINFYKCLYDSTILVRCEEKCEAIMIEYNNLIQNNENLREWLIKHYAIYDELRIYFFDYLQYTPSDNKNIVIAKMTSDLLNIYIQKEDLINSLKFHNIYSHLFHEKKLYPENLKWWKYFSHLRIRT